MPIPLPLASIIGLVFETFYKLLTRDQVKLMWV